MGTVRISYSRIRAVLLAEKRYQVCQDISRLYRTVQFTYLNNKEQESWSRLDLLFENRCFIL